MVVPLCRAKICQAQKLRNQLSVSPAVHNVVVTKLGDSCPPNVNLTANILEYRTAVFR